MTDKDTIYRGITADEQFRILAVNSSKTAQKIRDIHDLYPLSTIMMGRLISAAAMMSLDIKHESAELSLRIDSEAALKGAVAVINSSGELKAYPFVPQLYVEPAEDNFHPGKHLLPGTLTIIRSMKLKSPYTGTIELITGELADDLAYYYQQSEQVATAVNLGVLIDPSARVRASGGFMVQQLPGADPAVAQKIIQNLAQTPNISDLMDMGLNLPAIIDRFVLKDLSWKVLDEKPLSFNCNCSRQRFADALRLLGKEELSTMTEGIEPVCHYCNTSYRFDSDDIKTILESL